MNFKATESPTKATPPVPDDNKAILISKATTPVSTPFNNTVNEALKSSLPPRGKLADKTCRKLQALPEPTDSMFMRVKLAGEADSLAGTSVRPTTAGSVAAGAGGTIRSSIFNMKRGSEASMTGPAYNTTGPVSGGQQVGGALVDAATAAGDPTKLSRRSADIRAASGLGRLSVDGDQPAGGAPSLPPEATGQPTGTTGGGPRHPEAGTLSRSAWLGVRSAGFSSTKNQTGRREIRIPQG